MKTHVRKTAQLGDLVVAAFEQATRYTTDPEEVSHLATRIVMRFLRRRRFHPFHGLISASVESKETILHVEGAPVVPEFQ